MVANTASDSDPATHGDLNRLRAELRGDLDRLATELRGDMDRLRLEVRGDIAHALHQQTWRILGLGVAVAGIVAAVLRLT
jgi:hypothetical protein